MRKRTLFLFLTTSMLLSGTALAAKPVQTITIAELSAHVANYDGDPVRVRGFINQCTAYRCMICDGPVYTSETCANIAGWRDVYASVALDRLYSFTEIVLAGEAFAGHYWEPGVEIDCFAMRGCTEGLAKAEAVEIIARRAVTTLPDSERGAPVPLLSRAKKPRDIADAAMLAIFAKDPRYGARIANEQSRYVAFAIPGKDDGRPVLRGYLCWDRYNGNDAAPPPTRENDLELDSLGNSYVCARAIKRGDADWVVTGHDSLFE